MTQPLPSALARDPLAALPDRFHQSAANLAELRRTATELRDSPDVLRSSLQRLDHDDASLEVIASRSYAHPNGFIKIVLYLGGGYGVRLHVWRPEPPDYGADTNPHGHRWEFASWVVVGGLREEIFTEAENGTWHSRFDYRRRDDNIPDLLWTGVVALQRVDQTVRWAGAVYDRARSVVHTVSPATHDLVVTLVLQGPTVFEPTPVYQPASRADHAETRLSPDELRKLLADVVAVL